MKKSFRRFVSLIPPIVALLALSVGSVLAQQPSQGQKLANAAQQKDMNLVGFNDLQARSAYQPIIHQQNGRSIAYVGHHGGEALNPLTGVIEKNGTSIVDVTDPRHPAYLHHIPGPSGIGEAGGAQMVRACSGSELPGPVANQNKHFLLRATANSHEVYDVTDPSNPMLVKTVVANLNDTHKSFWECDTGIAYLVSDGTSLAGATPSFPNWRADRMTQIFDLSDPANPFLSATTASSVRSRGLPGLSRQASTG